jgi:peroxiredoxin Q/BCP
VSFDTPAENLAFSEKYGFNFPLLCDTSRAMGLAYGACAEASAGGARRIGVVIDPAGKIKEYRAKVDAASYPSEILARI